MFDSSRFYVKHINVSKENCEYRTDELAERFLKWPDAWRNRKGCFVVSYFAVGFKKLKVAE